MMNAHEIDRLEQVVREDRYSRKNIREYIRKDIESSPALLGRMLTAQAMVAGYLQDDYYPKKQARINKIKLTAEEIVLETAIAVLPMTGYTAYQSAVSQLVKALDMYHIEEGIKTAAELLGVQCYSDMFDIVSAENSETGSMLIRSNYCLDEDTLQFIANTKYLPPLIVPPEPVTSNGESGYLTQNSSVILGKGNHHNEQQALDVLNIAAATPLSLDIPTLLLPETSKRPLDTPEKQENFRRMAISSREVYRELLDSGNVFYQDWKFDKRGRVYSQGYHVNIQSTGYKKALINLARKEVIEGVPHEESTD